MRRSAQQKTAALDRPRTSAGYVAVDTETTGLDEMRADLVGVSLCVEAGTPAIFHWPIKRAKKVSSLALTN